MSPPLSAIALDQMPASLEDPRLLIGALSAAVLLFGARLYRLVLVTPGLLIGVLLGLHLTAGSALKTQIIAAIPTVLSVVSTLGMAATMPRPRRLATPFPRAARLSPTSSILTISATTP